MKRGLWVIDVQEKLFPKIDRCHEIIRPLCFILEAAPLLGLPILVTEHYPSGLGGTLSQILERLQEPINIWEKTTFSGYADREIKQAADDLADEWVLVGIEAHICVLQTARDLKRGGKSVIVCRDAVSSRSSDDFFTAMGELRDLGVRVSCTETVVYDCIHDGASPLFKQLLPLIKQYA